MNLNDISYNTYLSNYNNTDTALVFASYQHSKIGSDLLRTALDSIKNLDINKTSVWVFDVGSPKNDFLVKSDEFKKFNFVYINYTPRSWSKTNFLKKLIKKFLFIKAPREGSYANAWTLEFAKNYFNKINYNPKYFMSLQTDIIFTNLDSIKDLEQTLEKNQDIIVAGFREQLSLNHKYKIIHSLGCMWNYDLFKKLELDFYPNLPNFDIGELAIAKCIDKGYKTYSYRNARLDKSLLDYVNEKKYNQLGSGVDICMNKNNEVCFLHLGRGIDKSNNNYSDKKKFSAAEWISWYNNNF